MYLTDRNILNIMEVHIMAYIISDDCVSCGACAGECPVGAISEGDGKYVIDADACVECGACAGVCPVGAPSAE
jgi:ferredoxin